MTRITVVGDLLLDRDVSGRVDRVCPDAPVPVLDVCREAARPGGAGLAAALLAQDGLDVTLVAAVGQDPAGHALQQLLRDLGVRFVALPTAGTTREKVRLRSGDQSLLRLDYGTPCAPEGEVGPTVLSAVEDADALLVSDYGGGVTHDPQLRDVLERAARRRATVWDPHVRGASPVAGVLVATPNQTEAAQMSGHHGEQPAAARVQADVLVRRWRTAAVTVTLGPLGALLSFGSGAPLLVPAPPCPHGDSCGAGDRFASAVAAALGQGEVLSAAVGTGVEAASGFVAEGALARLGEPRSQQGRCPSGWERVEQVRAQGGTVVATGGCFDLLHAGHVALLRAARALGDCLVVCLNSDDSVRRIKGADRPLVAQEDRASVLEALEYVDVVLTFDEDTPEPLLCALRPDVWAKGGDYALRDLPEARLLASWGGQSVVLPYLDGRSTTRLIRAARTTCENSREAS